MENQTIFNSAQLKILQMMSYIKTDEELEELQNVLSDYYAKKVDKEMDSLWENGIINEKTIEQWGKEHMRTPYK
jgi:hypothetical protein